MVATTGTVSRCMPLGRLTGINTGTPAKAKGVPVLVPTGAGLFGRVLDGLGRPIDGKGPLRRDHLVPLDNEAPRRHAPGADRHPAADRAYACWTR